MDKYIELTVPIIRAAIKVHSYWCKGLIGSIYLKSLVHELMLRKIEVKQQVKHQLKYKDLQVYPI